MIKGPHTQILRYTGAGPECHTVSKDLKAQTKLEVAVYATLNPVHQWTSHCWLSTGLRVPHLRRLMQRQCKMWS